MVSNVEETMEVKDFLYFEKMIVPQIITWIYWAEICIIFLANLGNLVVNFSVPTLVITLIALPLGILMARIFCELAIVLFKIHETLKNNS